MTEDCETGEQCLDHETGEHCAAFTSNQVLVATDAETGEREWRNASRAAPSSGCGTHTFHVPRSLLAEEDAAPLEDGRYRAYLACVGVALIVFPSVTVAACFLSEVLLHCWHHRLVRKGARRRHLPCLLQPMQQLVSAFCADCQADRFYRTVDQKRRNRKLNKNAQVLLTGSVS
ncbi:uncharacterized protein LOC132197209 [Neocloeon triangulifer]|uniref:uncharacterized protein LOC132197209 n=1 Tax=Neocloeon triangulifer TaxID=2078957 RepID=UPI00286EC117|nr:uncharacterized protein LOC132197209 [Neocloeon triangulifer]XP_059476323.1 uncharacterized protein LOC132197209 [Neocloeon triangulifer]